MAPLVFSELFNLQMFCLTKNGKDQGRHKSKNYIEYKNIKWIYGAPGLF